MRVLLIALTLISTSNLMAQDFLDFDELTQKDKIQALWQSYLNEELDPIQFYSLKDSLKNELTIIDSIRLQKIESSFDRTKSRQKVNIQTTLTDNEALAVASEWTNFGNLVGEMSSENINLIQNAKAKIDEINNFKPKTKSEMKDLFFNTPDYANYNNGEYKDTLKLFLFCRHDRRYPCVFVLKDIFDNPVRLDDQTLWSLPGLAHSRRELPYNVTNGYTPSGVHRMNSVMPTANKQKSFGKFRRVILDWVPDSSGETHTKEFLPLSAQDKSWWKEASVARDVGRSWLRIHGTGNRNTDRSSHFYPHYATSGCVSTREMKYDGVKYTDQRIILDTLMSAMQLAPVYNNEVNIKGILYVVELDDAKKPVTLEDLKDFGIE